MSTQPVFPGEPIRYSGNRHTWNNGFRRRWLALGAQHAAEINAKRRGGAAVPAYRIVRQGDQMCVCIPQLVNRRVEWWPMWCVSAGRIRAAVLAEGI